MPRSRNTLVSLEETPYYHCISRCVRRAFLCGEDKVSGKSYEHRKQWVADKLAELASVFAIEVCAYAIMSNHTHTVLKVNTQLAEPWSADEVISRWTQLFSANVLLQRYLKDDCQTPAEINKINQMVELWRERLTDISWFMRCLNESIARQANAEDNCTGRFWEGRFKSQALLNEQAVLACMVYVDLNPIRAGLSKSLEASEFTSISQRLKELSPHLDAKTNEKNHQPIPLAKFMGSSQSSDGIAYTLADYLELTDWTGRSKRKDKSGYIPDDEPKIIHKLGINADIWQETVNSFTEHFYTFIGPEDKMNDICLKQKKKWLTGIKICRHLFRQVSPPCH